MLTFITIKLYTTSNCHLCEQAQELLTKAGLSKQLIKVEIVYDPVLLALYGTRIPVLQRGDNLAELDWPFDHDSMTKFLQK